MKIGIKNIRSLSVVLFTLLFFSVALFVSGCSKEADTEGAGWGVSGVTKFKKKVDFGCDYKADYVVKYFSGGVWTTTMEGTNWSRCDAVRTESNMTPQGMPYKIMMTYIERRDLELSWQLFPKSKKYTEDTLAGIDDLSTGNFLDLRNEPDVEIEEVGKEVVNGYDCTKYRIKIGEFQDQIMEYNVWSAKKLGNVPIKTELHYFNGDILTTEYTNIESGKQPGDLFEIPPGFTKASDDEVSYLMMQEMMGGNIPGGIPMPPMGQ